MSDEVLWEGKVPVADGGNDAVTFRLMADHRLLWRGDGSSYSCPLEWSETDAHRMVAPVIARTLNKARRLAAELPDGTLLEGRLRGWMVVTKAEGEAIDALRALLTAAAPGGEG